MSPPSRHPRPSIKGSSPSSTQHTTTFPLSLLLHDLATPPIDAGAAPIARSEPRKLCSNRRRTSPPQATPPVPGASPSSTSTPSTLPSLAGALVSPPTPYLSRRRASLSSSTTTSMEPTNVKFYQLGNGGDLIFERDLDLLSDSLGRPHPEFHGVEVNDQHGGELQWIITADLRGKVEPPTSERILFTFRESSWLDGLARALQEGLARLCGQNVVAVLASRFAHHARRDAFGVPMQIQMHPQLRHHVDHLDYMLYQTQKELDNSRGYANQTHFALTQHGEAIKMLNKDRKSLRLQRAKKDATIVRLRAKIAALEITVKAQEDQLRELEDDDGGIDLQGGEAFLSDDDDFEEEEDPEEADFEFLEAAEDGIIPIDVDVDVEE
ncbi:hypothetical protein QYE76_021819 [Lolium multiflorum]|uniref:Uncharacterized protein n=1 Tax=Lolium multiflorum TaxID=4521 RepID=A0AAD8R9R8_LOLMU|nr:hypothetical protein QYE76_021819 [Lolium multiflorum]